MITIEAKGIVTEQGESILHVRVPAEVPPGEHCVVMVISAAVKPQVQPLGEFGVHQAGLTSAMLSLRRGDLYNDLDPIGRPYA